MKKGFTLIEVLTSLALLAVLAVAVNTYLISSLKSARKAAANSVIKSEGEMIQTSIVRNVSFAKRINGCTATSLNFLASDGSTIIYTLNSGRLVQSIDIPDSNPAVSSNLNSTRTSVAGCLAANALFACQSGGKTVDFCLRISTVGLDTSDNSFMEFRDFVYSNN